MTPKENARLRRIAREAGDSYVGRHWPSMRTLGMNGLSSELTERREKDPAIRRFIATFSPDFVLCLLDELRRRP